MDAMFFVDGYDGTLHSADAAEAAALPVKF